MAEPIVISCIMTSQEAAKASQSFSTKFKTKKIETIIALL
jgi:hypothetical protein